MIFLKGERLTGKIVSATAGKLVLKADAAGEVTIDLAKVRTSSTDEPIVVKRKDGDYLLNLAAGAKVKITKAFFTDVRFEFAHDGTPASGRDESDTRFLIGGGWQF